MQLSVKTSTLLAFRAESVVEKRIAVVENAYERKDMETFAREMMRDSNQFHATCFDTYPPIFYMNDASRAVVRLIHSYNDDVGSTVAGYTFDAGPQRCHFC